MDKQLISISKRLSRILRHQLDQFEHDTSGYVQVSLITTIFKDITDENLNIIVSNDSKNRYRLITKGHHLYIRANQGHSSGNLNDDSMLELITIPIEGCFHGTYGVNIPFIMKDGLSRMSRKHIHIAASEDAKSGKRASCNRKIYINMALAMENGIKFYRSSNNVILTPGDDNGMLLSKYFLYIEVLE
jgi:2'-phosphotransferase